MSSWNSSEEDDSLGGVSSANKNKFAVAPQMKPNVLNQIDEETSRLNETGLNSTKNEVT